MPTEKARADMEKKYAWAHQMNGVIQQQYFLYQTLGKYSSGLAEIRQAFWAFLEAYQQIRAHHGLWVRNITGQNNQGTRLLDAWKAQFLTPKHMQAWDLLRDLRTKNAHGESVLPDIGIRQVIRMTHDGSVRVTHDGQVRGGRVTYLAVSIAGQDYDLLQLAATNLLLLRRFVDTFNQVIQPN